MPSVFVTVIACGGQGRRFGSDKNSLALDGRSLIDRAIDIAQSYNAPVALAVRDAEQLAGSDLPRLTDERPEIGPIAALLSGFRFAQREDRAFVLLLAADQPFLPHDLASRLSSTIGDYGVAIPVSKGQDQNMAALWRADIPALEAYIDGGGRSLWGFAEQVGIVRLPWEEHGADPFADIDDRSQLNAAEARIGKDKR